MAKRRSKMVMVLAAVAAAAACVFADEIVGWESDFSSKTGWYSNSENPSYQTDIDMPEAGVLRVTQNGKDGWGKAAVVVKDIDLDRTSILEAQVNKVDADSAFKIAVAPLDWSDLYVVIPRSSADGIHSGDLKAATGWTGKKSFNVVLIVEGKGKSTWFKHLKISSAQGQAPAKTQPLAE